MFHPITIPFDAVMLSNVVKLKDGVTVDDAELALGEMCNVVKNTYGNDEGGFIAGQVFKYSGFISEEGSFDDEKKSHADHIFKEKFSALAELCDETYELGYQMLWQGDPESA